MATFALSDLHGCMWAWEKIKSFINPDDEIICLGDLIDRGPQSWELFKTVYNDPQVTTILRGNHEDMLINACEDYIHDDEMWDYYSYNLCYQNGGEQTLLAWEIDPERKEWLNKLKKLPTWDFFYNVNNQKIILSHAGFTPWLNHQNTECVIPPDSMLIWNREHLYEDWNDREMEDVIIVHGHTTIIHLIDYVSNIEESVNNIEIITYCDGHKIDIDLCTVYTNKVAILNLDTLTPIYFEKDVIK